MEYPWRPRPPTANFCPVCSNSHFPFCTPPPPQYIRPPLPPPNQFFHARQPPPPPPPSYDPFVDHQGGSAANPYPPHPPPAQVTPPPPPPPWSDNPNSSSNCYGTVPYPDYDQSAQVGVKRMRFDNANESFAGAFSDDERRLKLIHDHGAVVHVFDKSYNDGGYNKHLKQSFEAGNFGDNKGNLQIKRDYGEHQFAYQQPENKTNAEFARSNYNQSDNKMVQNHMYGNNAHGSNGSHNYNQPVGNPGSLQYQNSPNQEPIRPFPVGCRDDQFLQSHQHHLEPTPGYYSLPNYAGFKVQPPLPPNPPPPMSVEPPRFRFPEPAMTSGPGSLFPIAVDSASPFQPPSTFVSEGSTSVSSHYSSHATPNSSSYYSEEIQAMKIVSSKTHREHEVFPSKHLPLDNPKLIDASHILKHPHRADRPDHIVIILRGLPGSGKSYLAKILRDLEVEHGCSAPRIHSMDEYFMTEVEKVEESEGSKSSGPGRGKKPTIKKVMEYCYEPEMEEAYRSSMLKAFKKTLDEGNFPFVIVDDRNLRVADFAQFWATAKRSGYEVYLLEATYRDPAGCAARNVHGFSQNEIQVMANQWEEAPSLYMKLDIKSLLHGDNLEENGIQEVDMDTDDGNFANPSVSEDVNNEKDVRHEGDSARAGRVKDELNVNTVETHPVEEVKELGKSKWSNDLDEDDARKSETTTENSSALSNLMRSYSKKGKSVRWADKVGSSIGFSIGSGKSGVVSLIIGPGSGYNSRTNPPPEDEKLAKRTGEPRKRTIFQEQLRAEGEAFKAVIEKRRHRIGGLDIDDE